MTSKSGDAITLPSGGGALKGIGETFQPNLFTGTCNHSVPIAVSPGREGFALTLSLQYSSGNGNGPFGLGWTLSIPRISRKTEKGLPRYDDTDVFVISGHEDLLPLLKKVVDPVSGEETWTREEPIRHNQHTAHRYRPRTEGSFARIERWQHDTTGEVHWRTITRDNVTSIYGRTSAARIADPADQMRVSEWLLQESFDAKGNHILYEYARDNPRIYESDDPSEQLSEIFERNRNATQLYIRRIYYSNLPSPLVDELGVPVTYANGAEVGHLRNGRRYAFEVVFDYGDWELPTKPVHPDPLPDGEQELFGLEASVPIRRDRFSQFRAGFEVRTLRRCRRVLMFHHFAELGGPTLVRSTDFEYRIDPDTLLSLLTNVTVTAYRRGLDGNYSAVSVPPVTFAYSAFRPHEQTYQSLRAEDGDLPPTNLKDPTMALVDLFGDGLPDFLQSTPLGFRYWKNLGGGLLDRPRSLPQVPPGISLGEPGVGFGDMGGDGQADLLIMSGPQPGFFETTAEETWQTFRPFELLPSFSLSDPNVRLFDVTGNGLSDAMQTANEQFIWFECLGEKGYGPPQLMARRPDLDQFPDVFFDDPRVRLADMSGTGLNDIVLIHNGRVEYWPNLGYGRFGKRITMQDSPRFDIDFDPKRLFLADVNGTGCADLIYVDFDRVHFFFNRSGNSWGPRETVFGTPIVSESDSLTVADVLGTGTASLVWSYDFREQPEGNYKILDLCGGIKPYVLTEMSNNLGSTTRVSYSPSTKHFLQCEAEGKPWVTKLPFPVQVVDQVEIIDHISRTRLVQRFKYHHGYFDGREREFRGFGRVDQFDTETLDDFARANDSDLAAFHVPPVETRSWFHTGIYFDDDSTFSATDAFRHDDLTRKFRQEFYQGDENASSLENHDVADEETPHEAFRALRGAILRTEVYGRDDGARSEHPYSVTEYRHRVRRVQPKDGNNHAVYFRHSLETLTYNYERNPEDPRTHHAMTLEVDEFGNTRRSLAVTYGRRQPDATLPSDADREKQARMLIAYSETEYTNAIDDPIANPDDHRAPQESEERSYELTGFTPLANQRFSFDEWVENDFARIDGAVEIPFDAVPGAGAEQKRLTSHIRTYYRANDLVRILPLGTVESLALPGELHRLAFTSDLVTRVFGNRVTDAIMANDGGYIHSEEDNDWWVSTGRIFYSTNSADTPAQELASAQRHFFLPLRVRDSFGNETLRSYDAFDLFLIKTVDALGNQIAAVYDYRILQPFRVTDPNGNRTEIAFDTLGLVAATAVMGKETESSGDSLAGFVPDLTLAQHQAFMADPLGQAVLLLGQATTRVVSDFDQFQSANQPVFRATLSRETHSSDPPPPGGLVVQVDFSYSDGFGREIQTKSIAEPGPVADGGPVVDPRWLVTGWTTFNNKGKAVKQHEPFFDSTHEFRFDNQVGVSATVFYDPLERIVATLRPDHAWSKVVFNAWQQETWDFNDTVLIVDPSADEDVGVFFQRLPDEEYLPTWHAQRSGGLLGENEKDAALKTAVHAATPATAYADSLGRTFLTTLKNRFERNAVMVEQSHIMRVVLDLEGCLREVIDAEDRVVMRYEYDMLRRRIHRSSMDAGERWTLNDVAGYAIYAWDSRGHRFRTTYDPLTRPTATFLARNNDPELLVNQWFYGESLPNPEAGNVRGKLIQAHDQAGITTTNVYDFKGNPTSTTRRFMKEFRETIDWKLIPEPESEVFSRTFSYDARNRMTSCTRPDGSVFHSTFNRRGLLQKVIANLFGSPNKTEFVVNIDYDAKGQRTAIEYGNGVTTTYDYDPNTFRLTQLQTLRSGDQVRLQDVTCTYDAAGHITSLRDDAQPTIFFNNEVIRADAAYTYDAIYRLIQAKGREHIGQQAQPQTTSEDRFRVGLPHPGDPQAMRGYTEDYTYDLVGNLEALAHQAVNGNWTRTYEYEPHPNEPGKTTNRLRQTVVLNVPESYAQDAHGNMISMPHLTLMEWDQHDHLQQVNLGGGGNAHYVYDSNGQRTRKVVVKNGGALIEEHLYLGDFEIFRRRDASGTIALERETLHVMDNEQRIALIETKTVEAGSPLPRQALQRYKCPDRFGSAALELDEGAKVISYEEYYPYGSTSYQAVASEARKPKRYRYAAKERDEETGLAYFGARYYAPWIGRWTAVDPAVLQARGHPENDQSVAAMVNVHASPFAYCSADPINRVDPGGSLDYYNKEGEYLGNDGRPNDNNFLILLNKRDVKTVSDRYSGSWLRRHGGEILSTVVGAIAGAIAGLFVLGVGLAALLGAAAGYLVGRFLFKDTFLKKDPTKVSDIVGARVTPPSEQVRRAISAAVERQKQPTLADNSRPGFVPDAAGGLHEEGGIWGIALNGEEVIGQALPGSFSDPRTAGHATISLTQLVAPVHATTVGTFHIHPERELEIDAAESNPGSHTVGGERKFRHFEQTPSGPDFTAAQINQQSTVYQYDIVVGARSGEVYFYQGTNTVADPYMAKISLKRFKRGL